MQWHISNIIKHPKGRVYNNCFSSVFTIERLNNVPQLGQYEGNILDTFNSSTEEVQEKLHHFNIYKSTGPDMLHPRILRALEDRLAGPLKNIFNNSVETGIIPEDWKSANVTAIRKKAIRQEPANYQPISVTSVVCKTMEKLVMGRLITLFEMKNLIGDTQHGFGNKRSCMISLPDFFPVIDTYDTDNNKAVDLVYLDFQKSIWQGATLKTIGKRQCTRHSRWCNQMDQGLVSWSSSTGMHQPILQQLGTSYIWCTTRYYIRPTFIPYLYKWSRYQYC